MGKQTAQAKKVYCTRHGWVGAPSFEFRYIITRLEIITSFILTNITSNTLKYFAMRHIFNSLVFLFSSKY